MGTFIFRLLGKPFMLVMLAGICHSATAQETDSLTIPGTNLMKSLPYGHHQQQNLDLYIPHTTKGKLPLMVWIHGGAWEMGYKKWIDVPYLAQQGFVVASIDYRFSGDSIFPAQIRDCNAAIHYLWQHAAEYHIDTSKIIVGGGSAGGHLASLIGTSHNNSVAAFYPFDAKKDCYRIRAVLDFYGPSDFYAFHVDYNETDKDNTPINRLLGASPLARPDLAKAASPTSYIDAGDPPVLILHGDKDNLVPLWQSILFKNSLQLAGVKTELITIAGAGHAGPAFATADIQQKVLTFLKEVLKG